MARCTFFEGRYFLGHPNTPRPISKDAGTVPAHFDLGFIGQLSKLTFRPTVDVQLGYVRKISKIVLDYATRALINIWTLKKKTKLKMDLIVHFADLEPLEQENVESFTAVLRW